MIALKEWTLYLAGGIEAAAALIIGFAAVEAMLATIRLFITRNAMPAEKEALRVRFGQWLAVALEFEVGADILRTAVAPSWNEIGQLAAIVLLRTGLNYFLQKEIEKAAEQPRSE